MLKLYCDLKKVIIIKGEYNETYDIDGNATLKRLMMMGSNVLLIPENDNYEPIMLQCDEVRIIGVAVGIVKCI